MLNTGFLGRRRDGRRLKVFGHDTWPMPARYVRPYSKGQTVAALIEGLAGHELAIDLKEPPMSLRKQDNDSEARLEASSQSSFLA